VQALSNPATERVIRKPCHVLPAGVTSRILFPGASGTVIAGSAFLFRVTITELAVPWHWQQTLLPQRPDRTMSHHASCHQILIPVSRYQPIPARNLKICVSCPVPHPTRHLPMDAGGAGFRTRLPPTTTPPSPSSFSPHRRRAQHREATSLGSRLESLYVHAALLARLASRL
jgi:hypothetical protein